MSWFTNILIVKIFLRDSYCSDTNVCIYVERCFSKQLLFVQKEVLLYYFSKNTTCCHLDSSSVKPIVLFLFLLISSTFEFSFYAESLVLSFIIRVQKYSPPFQLHSECSSNECGRSSAKSAHSSVGVQAPRCESDERDVTSRGGMAALKQQSVV